VLVLVSTYTANLASFFTLPATRQHGPSSFDDLSSQTGCFTNAYMTSHIGQQYVRAIDALPGTEEAPITSMIAMNDTLLTLGTEYCLESVQSGRSDVYIEDRNQLHLLHLERCGTTAELDFVAIQPVGYLFLTRGNSDFGLGLGVNLSKAIVLLQSEKAYHVMEREFFHAGERCPEQQVADELAPVTVSQMGGLFAVCATLAVASVLLALVLALPAWVERQRILRTTPVLAKALAVDGGRPSEKRTHKASRSLPAQVPRMRSARSRLGLKTEGDVLSKLLSRVDDLRVKLDDLTVLPHIARAAGPPPPAGIALGEARADAHVDETGADGHVVSSTAGPVPLGSWPSCKLERPRESTSDAHGEPAEGAGAAQQAAGAAKLELAQLKVESVPIETEDLMPPVRASSWLQRVPSAYARCEL